jgi:hypothetical protein
MLPYTANIRSFLPFIIISFLSACGPKIYFFQIRPCTTITKTDSVQFTWQVRGIPTLLHYQEDAEDPDIPKKEYAFYKLVAKRGKKEVAYPTLGLTILPETSVDYILINTIKRGDSAIAIAIRDTLVWGKRFILDSVASGSNRNMTVTHLGKTVVLKGNGAYSSSLKGLPNSGLWELGILLSPDEIKDSTRIPGRLMIKTIIIHQ